MKRTIQFVFPHWFLGGPSKAPGGKRLLFDSLVLIQILERHLTAPPGQDFRRGILVRANDALFRTFADSDLTPAGAEEFARQYARPGAPIELGAVDDPGRVLLFVSRVAP